MDKYYKVLEIPNNSSKDEIRKAYKKMAVKWHPDKNINNKEVAEKKFKEISEAYEILMDDNKKNNININNFHANSMPRNFSDPFDIFNKIFKDQNLNNIRNANTFFNTSFSSGGNFNIHINRPTNIFTRSESIQTNYVNGIKHEKKTIIENGKKTIIVHANGKFISKELYDNNGNLIEN